MPSSSVETNVHASSRACMPARSEWTKSGNPPRSAVFFPGTRRELNAVNWSHPAYANKHIIQRNDEEIIRASLDARDY